MNNSIESLVHKQRCLKDRKRYLEESLKITCDKLYDVNKELYAKCKHEYDESQEYNHSGTITVKRECAICGHIVSNTFIAGEEHD